MQPTKDNRLIGSVARRLVDQIYVKDLHFAKAGVGLLDLVGEGCSQSDLFVSSQFDLSSEAMAVVDTLNKRYGRNTIFFASQGIHCSWSMTRNMKSPAYIHNKH